VLAERVAQREAVKGEHGSLHSLWVIVAHREKICDRTSWSSV
jgi:hypothetical protein